MAVGLVQLRRISRPEAEPLSKRDKLSVFGARVVISVFILAAMYFFGYAVGFHHGSTHCKGVYVSPQARAAYPNLYPSSGCFPLQGQ